MVKFLLQHAIALDEKVEDVPQPWQVSTTPLGEGNMHLERSRVTQSIIADLQNVE